MRKLLCSLAVCALLSSIANATTVLLEIELDLPGLNADVTFSDDGTIFIDRPIISNLTVQLPSWIMPPNCEPIAPIEVEVDNPDQAIGAVAGIIGGYSIGEWIEELGGQVAMTGGIPPTDWVPSRLQAPETDQFAKWSVDWCNDLVTEIIAQVSPYVPVD